MKRALVALGLAACGSGSSLSGDGGLDIPLTLAPLLQPLGDGGTYQDGVRLALQFGLGGQQLSAFLDTGSSGIQVIASDLSSAAQAAITPYQTAEISEEFESGIVASGVVSKATISLGAESTPEPIPILLIQQITCSSGADCQGFTEPLSSYLFQGYSAIVGVGMRNGSASVAPGLGNPIVQLPGSPSFAVEIGDFGSSTGTLRIAPSAQEVAGFTTFQLPADAGGGALANGVGAWDDTALPSCVNNSNQSFCGNAILDTGSPETVIFWQGISSDEELQPGATAQVVVGPAASPLETFEVTVGTPPQAGLDEFVVVAPVSGSGDLLNLGLTVFYRYNVYFDQLHGLIGLSTH